jgi:hypothetical protein
MNSYALRGSLEPETADTVSSPRGSPASSVSRRRDRSLSFPFPAVKSFHGLMVKIPDDSSTAKGSMLITEIQDHVLTQVTNEIYEIIIRSGASEDDVRVSLLDNCLAKV